MFIETSAKTGYNVKQVSFFRNAHIQPAEGQEQCVRMCVGVGTVCLSPGLSSEV